MAIKCKVVLDSSILLQTYEGIDVIELIGSELGRCEYYVLDTVIEELRRLAVSDGLKGKAANLALQYLNTYGVKVIDTLLRGLNVDDSLIVFFQDEYVRREYIVATNDVDLRRKLLKLGVRVITWWSGKFKYVLIES